MDDGKKKAETGVTVEGGHEVVDKTIVGGRPRRRKTYRMNIPAGIEKILYVASIDGKFRSRLLGDRAGTLAGSRIRLTPSESAVLATVSDETLAHMIGQIRPKMHGKRRFMRAVAVAAVTLATGTAGVACEDEGPTPEDTSEVGDVPLESEDPGPETGDMADVPTDLQDLQDTYGDTADVPDVPFEIPDTVADAGVEPDLPDADDEEEESD